MSQQTLGQFGDKSRCPTCGRDDFESERGMRIHHKLVHDESLANRSDRFRCPECEREVATKRGFSVHLAKIHPEVWERIQKEGMTLTLENKE